MSLVNKPSYMSQFEFKDVEDTWIRVGHIMGLGFQLQKIGSSLPTKAQEKTLQERGLFEDAVDQLWCYNKHKEESV